MNTLSVGAGIPRLIWVLVTLVIFGSADVFWFSAFVAECFPCKVLHLGLLFRTCMRWDRYRPEDLECILLPQKLLTGVSSFYSARVCYGYRFFSFFGRPDKFPSREAGPENPSREHERFLESHEPEVRNVWFIQPTGSLHCPR